VNEGEKDPCFILNGGETREKSKNMLFCEEEIPNSSSFFDAKDRAECETQTRILMALAEDSLHSIRHSLCSSSSNPSSSNPSSSSSSKTQPQPQSQPQSHSLSYTPTTSKANTSGSHSVPPVTMSISNRNSETSEELEGGSGTGCSKSHADAIVANFEAKAEPASGKLNAVLEKYQEMPNLLDSHLESLITPIIDFLHSFFSTEPLLSSTAADGAQEVVTAATYSDSNPLVMECISKVLNPLYRVLYVLCKMRGYKTIGILPSLFFNTSQFFSLPNPHPFSLNNSFSESSQVHDT
jgi:hypothetical protein